MAKTITPQKRDSSSYEAGMVPASTELPADIHAKVAAAADANDRSFAAQLRVIAKEWAAKQPAN